MQDYSGHKRNVLTVKMFGNFSMIYGDKSLFERKTKETQFSYLMQLLLHHREEGVTRERLEEVLFADREITDVHHAMRTVIYNAKKRLEKTGLPKVNYIVQEEGIYYWTKEIPVEEDAEIFERLYLAAQETTNQQEKLQYLMDACHCYQGEFLKVYASVVWAAAEARRYRAMFTRCVEEVAQILREQKEYIKLEQLGVYATKIAPFCDWEALTMEAMIGMGRYDDAGNFYAETVDSYFEQRGLKPSQKLLDTLDLLGNNLVHPFQVLDTIQEDLAEQNSGDGAYFCSYPVFQGIYQALTRMMNRSGQSIYLMMCSVIDSKGNPMKEGSKLDDLSERLQKAIMKCIRTSDVVCRYGKGQYMILLINTSREDCAVVQRRIDQKFRQGRQRTGVRYYANSIIREAK